MITLNSYFDKIYCLNLPSEKNRAIDSLARFKAFNITAEMVPATPGEILSDIYNSIKISKGESLTIPNANYLGCAISHLEIMKDALDNGYKRILILEDDLLIHKSIEPYFNDVASNQIPNDWDMLYLAWIPLSDDMQYWSYNVINDKFISKNVFTAKNLWSAMAYGLSESAMKWILSNYKSNFSVEIDRFYVNNCQNNLKCYGVNPQIFAGYDNYSSNSESYVSDLFTRSHDARSASREDYV